MFQKAKRFLLYAALLALSSFYTNAQAQVKFSQITNGGSVASSTDQLLAVRSGASDVLVTVGSSCVENLTSIVIDNGSGGLTLGAGQVTNNMLSNSSTAVNGQTCTLGSSCTVAAAAGTLTGSTLASGVTGSSLTSVGTISSGTWQGTAIGNSYLANSSTTVNGQTCTLGSSCTAPADFSTLTGTAAQGDILYYTGGAWAVLAPGTSGYFLETQGAGANPQWAAGGGGGSVTWPTSGDVVISNGTNTPGGVAPSGTSCLVSSSGSWVAGSCSSGSGTVTSITVGTGLKGSVSPITTTGTISEDALTLASKTATGIAYFGGLR